MRRRDVSIRETLTGQWWSSKEGRAERITNTTEKNRRIEEENNERDDS